MRAWFVVIAIGCVATAAAQPSGSSAQAEVLFRKGKQLMAAGKLGEACAAFDASQKLEPTVATRLNQANCREKNNQLATAWGLFLDAERETRAATDDATKGLHKTAVDKAAKLETRVSSIKIVVTAKVPGLEIRRDNEVVDPALWGTPLPLDAGTYKITARALNLPEWSQTVTLAPEKDAKTVDVPDLAKPKPVPEHDGSVGWVPQKPEPHVEPQPHRETPPPPPPSIDEPSRFTPRRKLALGVLGAGVVATAFGAARGTAAKNKQSDADALCPDPLTPCADADAATALSKKGHSLALQANIGFGLGAAAAIAAGVLWFTGAPSDHRVAVSPTANGFAVIGRF